MRHIKSLLVGLAFAAMGSTSAVATHLDFPMPLPTGISLGQVFLLEEASFSDPTSSTVVSSVDTAVPGAANGSFVAWFENPTVDASGDFFDLLTSVVWEVLDSANVVIATGGLSDVNTAPIFFMSNTTRMSIRARAFSPLTGDYNIGMAVAYVPEPATWIMMILGFGLIGLQMRRQARTRVEMA